MKFYCYLVFAFLAFVIPLAFGGAEPWGLLIFNSICLAFGFFILFKKQHFCLTGLSKRILVVLGFIILLALLQLLNQHNFLQKPAFLPFTLCRYYTLEGLSWLFSLTLFYFAMIQIVARTKEIKVLALILTISAVLISLIGITWHQGEYIHAFTGVSMFSSFGPFTSRNHGSQFVMASFFISLLLWLPRFIFGQKLRLSYKNIWFFTFSVILFFGVFFTHSRGGVIAMFLGLFTIFFISILFLCKERLYKVIYLLFAICVFGGVILLIVKYSSDIGLRQFGTFSDQARLLLYNSAFSMLKDFPWTGVGFDAFSAAIDAYLKVSLKAFPRYLHNDWLDLLLSFGYIYGTIIFMLIGAIIYKLFKLFAPLEPQKQLRLAIICGGLVGLSFTALVDFPFHLPACAFVFFCLLIFASMQTFDKNIKKVVIPLFVKILLVLIGLGLFWGNIQYFRTWRAFVFARKFAPRTRMEQVEANLKYPSPVFIKRVLLARYKTANSKDISAEEKQQINKETHELAKAYLKIYPKDREISQFYLLTK
ncbi:MAG: O-antigen ligase family protein [Elusimicrobiaceae bacterium]|nr:O-antigen ligase family protein [Elusimicrobiaceae bacterium]